jgi:DDE superfamily endonuclease/Helix-turn-helix of DDE superfamily endonuclease
MTYSEARTQPRVFRQLTGLTIEEFDQLLPGFQAAYEDDVRQRQTKPRQRAPGAGRKSVLGTWEDKLFFILFYFRHYPTQEVLAFWFGFSQGQANQWIHRLTPILNRALGRELQLPARSAADLAEVLQACDDPEFIIDGTDRPTRRPQDSQRQRSEYNGRKKRHTKKNIVITEKASGEVLGLGATQPGSRHDKACADAEGYTFPEGSTLYQDTGFQGYTPEGATTQQPTKKPRGKELTPEQKAENRTISQERIGVEHSLGGIKIFHIVSSVFRNIKEGFDDLVMEVACGLFNFCRTCRSTA